MSEEKLKKSVTFIESLAIIIGLVIGSGIFIKPAVVLKNAGSPGMAVMTWIVGGLITLCAALSISEIAGAIPKTGGFYTYLKELYGDVWGFLYGWVELVISYPGSTAALAIAFATYASFFVPLTAMQQKVLAILMIALFIGLNILATKYGSVVQTLATIGKLIPMIVIIAVGLISGTAHDLGFVSTGVAAGSGFGAAILGVLWAFDGWISITYMAGEVEDAKNKLPKAIVVGVLVVLTVYTLFNVAIFNTMPADQVANSEMIASDVAVKLFGTRGAIIINIGILISVFGALNGNLMTGARIPFAMGEQKQLPCSEWFCKVHPKFATPANALITIGVISVIYILLGTFNTITDFIEFVLWIFFTFGVLGVFVLRKRVPAEKRPFKVPLYPITPILGMCGGLFILVSTLRSSFLHAMIGIGLTLLGLPIYYYVERKKKTGEKI